MLNRVIIVGRLVRNVDLRYSKSGVAVVNFTIASSRTFKTQDGQDADFINCVAFRKQAENLAQFMSKGSQIGVDGRLQSRIYENNEGRTVFVTEVVADSVQFLEPKKQQSGNTGQSNEWQDKQKDPFRGNGEPIDIQDDDGLPF